MRLNLPSAWSPIGLDIGTHRVNAVQLDAIGRVRAFASFGRSHPDSDLTTEEAARIRSILDRCGFRGSSTVIAANPGMIRTTVLELPPASSGAPVEQLARQEISRIHKISPDSFALGMWELPPAARASAATQTMAVSCANEAGDSLCDRLESAGIEPIAIDLTSAATVRALPIDPEQTQAVLDFGESRAVLTVVHKGTIIFERMLSELTLRTFRSQLAKALRMPVTGVNAALREKGIGADSDHDPLTSAAGIILEPFVEEIAHSAAYASSKYADAIINKVFLVGCSGSIPGLAPYLARTLECEFVSPRLSELAGTRSAIEERSRPGEGVTALGLARWRSEAA